MKAAAGKFAQERTYKACRGLQNAMIGTGEYTQSHWDTIKPFGTILRCRDDGEPTGLDLDFVLDAIEYARCSAANDSNVKTNFPAYARRLAWLALKDAAPAVKKGAPKIKSAKSTSLSLFTVTRSRADFDETVSVVVSATSESDALNVAAENATKEGANAWLKGKASVRTIGQSIDNVRRVVHRHDIFG